MKEFCQFFVIFTLIGYLAAQEASDVGYRIGQVTNYKKLREFRKSQLFEVECPELDDGRPIKLLKLVGTHYDTGYDYGKLMGQQIKFTYDTFFHSMLDTQFQIKVIEVFLDWQYQSYVRKQLPLGFIQELKGLAKAGSEQKIPLLGVYFERVLVISSFPGALQNDIISILADELLKKLGIHNEELEGWIQDNYQRIKQIIQKFRKKVDIHCSFFAVWGSRTQNGDLYTMRNLDWAENTGVNQNKLITVWAIDDTIPHLTLGYPGVLGALTGMSAAGITVHEAGLSSHLSTELGFQWTLRMRHVMMYAKNLEQANNIWKSTNNTLGMNFMIASISDLSSNHPALVLETMRGYSAQIKDFDSRQNGTMFKDPKTNKTFQAGYSMPQAVFRTNHAYDPIIRDHLRSKLTENDDSMIRYRVLKDGFKWYQNQNIKMGKEESVNMTAILGDKGSQKFLSCQNNFQGVNVISVTYQPSELKMWAAFEYGFQKTFRSACCGVYVEMDMREWLSPNKTNLKLNQ